MEWRKVANQSLLARYHAYLHQRNLAARTIDSYSFILHNYAASIDKPLVDATKEDVLAWLAGCRLDARARYTYISTVHGLYVWAIGEEIADRDPTLRVPRPKLPRRLPRPMSPADLLVALQHADTRMRLWLCLDAFQGLRCQEIAGLRVDDLQLWMDPPVLVISAGKGDKERAMELNLHTEHALLEFGVPRSGFLFVRRNGHGPGEPVRAKYVSQQIAAHLDSLGITARAHNGRHLFGTTVYAATHDIRLVQELLGHASIQTTQLYTKVEASGAHGAVRNLELPGLSLGLGGEHETASGADSAEGRTYAGAGEGEGVAEIDGHPRPAAEYPDADIEGSFVNVKPARTRHEH